MVRDALICRKGRYGWRWCVVPLGLVKHFREVGWINVLNTDDMEHTVSEAIAEVRKVEEQKPGRVNRANFFRRRPQQGNCE
jgi:hypothetical protein